MAQSVLARMVPLDAVCTPFNSRHSKVLRFSCSRGSADLRTQRPGALQAILSFYESEDMGHTRRQEKERGACDGHGCRSVPISQAWQGRIQPPWLNRWEREPSVSDQCRTGCKISQWCHWQATP